MTDEQPPLPLRLLLVHQHMHGQRGDRVGAGQLAVNALRLFSDHFAEAVDLAPITEDVGDGDELVEFPANVTVRPLYRRAAREPRLTMAWRHLRSLPRLAREVAATDVVQARLPSYPAFVAAGMALLLRRALVLSIHGDLGAVLLAGDDSAPLRALSRLLAGYQRFLADRSDLVLTMGESSRELAGPRAIAFANHQFGDEMLFERADTCAGPTIRLLYVGRLCAAKGTDELLAALATLRGRGLAVRLSLAGPPVDYDLEAALARHGVAADVDVLGSVPWGPRLFALYRGSDILVFPSRSEGLPKVPMEALSQCLPVVATTPGTSVYVEHEVAGLLTAVGDAAALADAIARMISDGELRRRCIRAGFAVAQGNTREQLQARLHRALVAALL